MDFSKQKGIISGGRIRISTKKMPPKGDRGIILLHNNLNNYSNNTEMTKGHERTYLLKTIMIHPLSQT